MDHPYLANPVTLAALQGHGLPIGAGFGAAGPPPPGAGDPGAMPRDPALHENLRLAEEVGGPPLGKVAAEILRRHGAAAMIGFVAVLAGDPRARDLYALRRRTADVARASGGSTQRDVAEHVVRQVNALEVQTLSAVLANLAAQREADRGAGRPHRPRPPRPPLPTHLGSREVGGRGGYRYRQYADGTIVILVSPRGGEPTIVARATRAWRAITAEIGPFPAAEARPVEVVVKAVAPAVAKVAIPAVLKTGGAAVAAGGPVAAMLAAAGVSATVPVAGWIAAGGLAAGAAALALVGAIRRGEKDHGRIRARAHRLKIADADEMPAFLEKLLGLPPHRREALGHRIHRRLRAGKLTPAQRVRLESRLRLVAAADLHHRASARGRMGMPRGRLQGWEGGGGPAAPF